MPEGKRLTCQETFCPFVDRPGGGTLDESEQPSDASEIAYQGPRSGDELRDRTGKVSLGMTTCFGIAVDGVTDVLLFFVFVLFTTRVRIRGPGRAARCADFDSGRSTRPLR